MFQLTYLEDPPPGDISMSVMVSETAVSNLKMFCRGSEGCCGQELTRLKKMSLSFLGDFYDQTLHKVSNHRYG